MFVPEGNTLYLNRFQVLKVTLPYMYVSHMIELRTQTNKGKRIYQVVSTNPFLFNVTKPIGTAATPANGHPKTTAHTHKAHAYAYLPCTVTDVARVSTIPANVLGRKDEPYTKHPAENAWPAKVTRPATGCIARISVAKLASANADANATAIRTA